MLRFAAPRRTVLIFTAAAVGMACLFLCFKPLYKAYRVHASKCAYDRRLLKAVREGKSAVTYAGRHPVRKMSSEKLKRIVNVLHRGVPGRYTSHGAFVEGVVPRPAHAIRLYEVLVRRRQADIYLDYAQLLEFGVSGHERLINKHKALTLYKMHCNSQTDPYAKYDALNAIERLSTPLERTQASFETTILANQIFAHVARKETKLPPQAIRTTGEDIWVLPEDGIRARAGDTVRNDTHNAHDSGVTKTVKASIDRLRRMVSQPVIDNTSALRDVRRLIIDVRVPKDKKERAICALDEIERKNQLIGSAGITEVELMGLVWNRIHHEDNKDRTRVLHENLLDELSDAIEHGKPVCAQGRFNRVLDTLNGVDKVVQIRPKWALQRELVDRAAITYKERVNALPASDQDAIDAPDPTTAQQKTYDQVMGEIKGGIREDFNMSYVEEGIMTQQDLDVEVSKFIDHIG